jgi:hypothetical protein
MEFQIYVENMVQMYVIFSCKSLFDLIYNVLVFKPSLAELTDTDQILQFIIIFVHLHPPEPIFSRLGGPRGSLNATGKRKVSCPY